MSRDDSSISFADFAAQVRVLAAEASRLSMLASRLEERQDRFGCALEELLRKAGCIARTHVLPPRPGQGVSSVLLVPHPSSAGSSLYIDGPASASFSVHQIKDFSKLLQRLRGRSDPVSCFLWQNLSSRDQLLLRNCQPSGPGSRQAKDLVVQLLNKIIGGSGFYEVERFKAVSMRPETSALVRLPHLGSHLSILNRFLLEDAYPLELSRNPGISLPPLVAVLMETLQADTGAATDPHLVGWKSAGAIRDDLEMATHQEHTEHAVKQLVFRLRRVLESHGVSSSLIQNDPRRGYRFAVRRKVETAAHHDDH